MPGPNPSLRFAIYSLLFLVSVSAETRQSSQSSATQQTQQKEDEVRGGPAEPDDAAEVRAQIAEVGKLLPTFVDRGAALYFLAAAHQHLGEPLEALELLKQCMEREEGFDPSGGPEFAGLRSERSFIEMAERAQFRFPAVATARVALVTEEKDLVPEGLAWDPRREVFYLSSLHRRTILQITPESHVSDFLQPQSEPILPVLGIRMDPNDGTIWANTWEEKPAASRSQLLHIDSSGKVIARYATKDAARHGFNDLVVRKARDVFVTDSLAGRVLRFDPATREFSPLHLHRPLFYPNGIALADDDHTLYVADSLGVIHYDISSSSSADVSPGPHHTLAGADGLYWHRGSLLAIQNGIGTPRIAAFKLSKDGLQATAANILEYRTTLSVLPTTGAVRGSDFYFICNSQIDNLNGDRILDVTRLEPVRIAVIHLP